MYVRQVKDIFLAALERACLANVSLVRNSSFSEICPVGVIVSPASMPVAPSLISRNSSSIFPDTEPLKLQACLSVQGQRSNENEPTGQVSDVILAQRDSTTGQLRLPLVLTHPFVSRSSVLPSEVRVELCIAVLRVTPPSEASLAEQPPEFWPSTTNAITWSYHIQQYVLLYLLFILMFFVEMRMGCFKDFLQDEP